LVLELGRVARLDFTLNIGQVSESLEVSEQASLLESETAKVGSSSKTRPCRTCRSTAGAWAIC
jgi:hypothetical protein